MAGLSRNSAPARFFVPFGIILIIFGCILLNFKTDKYVKTVGRITSVVEDTDEKGNQISDVNFTYETDGRQYNGTFEGLTGQFAEGGSVDVYYDPKEPANTAAGRTGRFEPLLFIAAGVLLAVFGIWRSAAAFRKSADLKKPFSAEDPEPSDSSSHTDAEAARSFSREGTESANSLSGAGTESAKSLSRAETEAAKPVSSVSEERPVDSAASGQKKDMTEYYFRFDGNGLKPGYILEDADRKVLFEGKMLKNALIGARIFEFTDHATGTVAEHEVGHTTTQSYNNEFFSVSSWFKFDGENIWDLLHERGLRFETDLHSKFPYTVYNVRKSGSDFARIETSSIYVHEEEEAGHKLVVPAGSMYYRCWTQYDDFESLFLIMFALSLTEQAVVE